MTEDPDGDCISVQAYLWRGAREAGLERTLGDFASKLGDDCALVFARSWPKPDATATVRPILVYCPKKTGNAKAGNSIAFLATWSDPQNLLRQGFIPAQIEPNACQIIEHPVSSGDVQCASNSASASSCSSECPVADPRQLCECTQCIYQARYAADALVATPAIGDSEPRDEVTIQTAAMSASIEATDDCTMNWGLPPLEFSNRMTLTVRATHDLTRVRVSTGAELNLDYDLQVPERGLRPFGVVEVTSADYQDARIASRAQPEITAKIDRWGSNSLPLETCVPGNNSCRDKLELPLRAALTGSASAASIAYCIYSASEQIRSAVPGVWDSNEPRLQLYFWREENTYNSNISPYRSPDIADVSKDLSQGLTLASGSYYWTALADLVAFPSATSTGSGIDLTQVCP